MLIGFDKILAEAEGKRVAVFLDYDGARSCVPRRGVCATESRSSWIPHVDCLGIAVMIADCRRHCDPCFHGRPAPSPPSAGVF